MVSRSFVKIASAVLPTVIVLMVYHGAFTFNHYTVSYPDEEPVVADTKRPPKIILQWTKFFGLDTYDGITSPDPLGCEISDCIITRNRSLLNQSDAILFHVVDTKLNDLPATRKDSQRYVYTFFEAPVLTHKNHEIFRTAPHFFNWTMTYRRDADIHNPYGQVMRRNVSANEDTSLTQSICGKKKQVAWFVSNCRTSSKREDYVKILTQHIPVNVYGGCGTLKCPKKDELSCDLMLRTDYKFYLAFENSNCRDYVTEKFFRSLQYDVVPIVYGGADYKKYAPPHSFIDIKDFNSAKDLADYLKLLDSNDRLYQAYFDWKREYNVDTGLKHGWCELCAKLHDPSQSRKSYENILDWHTDSSQCSKPFSPGL